MHSTRGWNFNWTVGKKCPVCTTNKQMSSRQKYKQTILRGRGCHFYPMVSFHFEGGRNAAYLESTFMSIPTFTNEEERSQRYCTAMAKWSNPTWWEKIRLRTAHQTFYCVWSVSLRTLLKNTLFDKLIFLLQTMAWVLVFLFLSRLSQCQHCQQSYETNLFSNEQSKAGASDVREQIYLRMYKESTNEAS